MRARFCLRQQGTFLSLLDFCVERRNPATITMRVPLYQDARLFRQRRNRQAAGAHLRVRALLGDHAADLLVVATAWAEHRAQARLAAQAERNLAAARMRLAEAV